MLTKIFVNSILIRKTERLFLWKGVCDGADVTIPINLGFESDVVLEGTQTYDGLIYAAARFESDVVLEGA